METNKNETVQKPPQPAIIPRNFTFPQLSPKLMVKETEVHSGEMKYAFVNVNASNLPQPLVSEIHQLEMMLEDKELTLIGFKTKKSHIIDKYMRNNVNHVLQYQNETNWLKKKKLSNYKQVTKNSNYTLHGEHHSLHAKNGNATGLLIGDQSKLLNLTRKASSRSLLWYILHQQNVPKLELHNSTPQTSETSTNTSETSAISIFNSQKKNVRKDDGSLATYWGKFPWEKQQLFSVENPKTPNEMGDYAELHNGGRRLQDLYAESLLHVNRLYNSEYGYQARKVPAHMPHFINKQIMEALQDRYFDFDYKQFADSK